MSGEHVTVGWDGVLPVCSCGRLGYAHRVAAESPATPTREDDQR